MQKQMLNKKGTLDNGLVIAIVILALTLAIGLTVIGGVKDTVSQINPTSVTQTVTNETNAYVNTTGYTLTYYTADNFGNPTITALWGVQGGVYNVSYLTGNATVTSAGVVTNTSTAISNASISYTYTQDTNYSEGYNATTSISTALGDVATWVPILIVIVLAGIILALVGGLGGKKKAGM